MTRDEKCAKWRKLHPGRAADLRRKVARMIGMPSASKLSSETVAEVCRPVEDELLSIVYGLSDDEPGATHAE